MKMMAGSETFSNKFTLKAKLELERERPEIEINRHQFEQIILEALGSLHGEVGKALPHRVNQYNEKTREAIIATNSLNNLKRLWSALSMFGIYTKEDCAFRVTNQTEDQR